MPIWPCVSQYGHAGMPQMYPVRILKLGAAWKRYVPKQMHSKYLTGTFPI